VGQNHVISLYAIDPVMDFLVKITQGKADSTCCSTARPMQSNGFTTREINWTGTMCSGQPSSYSTRPGSWVVASNFFFVLIGNRRD